MKKNYLMLAATAATVMAFSACNKMETINAVSETGSISFRTNLDYARLRGTEVNLQSLQQSGFKVYADKEGQRYFDERVSYGTPIPNRWSTVTPYYWPDAGTVKFWAYENDGAGTATVNSTEQKITNFTPAEAHSSTAAMVELQKDLVVAYGEGTKAANESTGLQLTFKHALAQIEIKAKNDNPTRTVKVLGVQIVGVDGKATLTLPTNNTELAWANNEEVNGSNGAHYDDLGNATTAVELDGTPKRIMKTTAGNNFMLIPQQLTAWNYTEEAATKNFTGAYIAVMMQVSENGAPRFPTATQLAANPHAYIVGTVAINTLWEAGKKYTYQLDFTNGVGNMPPSKHPEPTPNPGVTPAPGRVVPSPVTPDPGQPILGQPISFTVEVTDYVNVDQGVAMP